MERSKFDYLFKQVEGFYLTPDVIMFRKPVELFNVDSGESLQFKTVDDCFKHSIDGKTIADIVAALDDLYIEQPHMAKGGRGGSREQEFKFGHADRRGQGGSYKPLAPAYANTKIKSKTFEGALAEFKRNHLLSEREFAYEVDSQGYVHQYMKGGATSVGIAAQAKVRRGETTMIIHNHPSASNFSDSDLISASMQSRAKGIIASGRKYDYTFEKRGNFKGSQFIKAVKTAKLKGTSYDEAVDKWLKENQKKYGYTYKRKKN